MVSMAFQSRVLLAWVQGWCELRRNGVVLSLLDNDNTLLSCHCSTLNDDCEAEK